jgi:SPP1 family holin
MLAIALINQALVAFNLSPFPFEDSEMETFLSTAFTVVVAIWAWWKNNYVSAKGKAQAALLKKNGLK